MSQPAPSLSQHLLTRSDLVKLEIPADDVELWLADGRLDEVGSLCVPDAEDDPVMAVPDAELRRDLSEKLAKIGKDAVVFTSSRVRGVLQEAAEALDQEVDVYVARAKEEARLDALEHTAADRKGDGPAEEGVEGAAGPGADSAPAEGTPAEEPDFFDTEDLATEVDSWGSDSGSEAPSTANPSGNGVTPDDATAVDAVVEQAAEPEGPPTEVPPPEEANAATETEQAVEQVAEQVQPESGGELPTEPEVPFDPANQEVPMNSIEDPIASPQPDVMDELDDLVEPEAAAALAADESPVRRPAAKEAPAEDADAGIATARVDQPVSASVNEEATAGAMVRVESFLTELRGALVDLANRPQVPPIDMKPLVAAVGEFGQRIEHGVAVGVHAAIEKQASRQVDRPSPQFVSSKSSGANLAMLGLSFLLLCWAVIFWFKTGSARLALGTLVGANVIGCCLLAGRRR